MAPAFSSFIYHLTVAKLKVKRAQRHQFVATTLA